MAYNKEAMTEEKEKERVDKIKVTSKDNPYRLDNIPKEKLMEMLKKGRETKKANNIKKKNMQKMTRMILEKKVKGEKAKEIMRQFGITDEDMQNQTAMIIAQLNKAMKGDSRAFEVLRDTSGQRPVELFGEVEVPKIVDDISEDLIDAEFTETDLSI